MGLNDRVNALIGDLKSTHEYQELNRTRTVIDRNSKLKGRLVDFYKKQKDTFEGNLSEKEFEAKANELDAIYNDMLKIKEIDDFMKASKNFDDLVAKVFKSISDNLYS